MLKATENKEFVLKLACSFTTLRCAHKIFPNLELKIVLWHVGSLLLIEIAWGLTGILLTEASPTFTFQAPTHQRYIN